MKYVILAGGSGTRLWPLSRKNFAKQFLNLNNDYSMLQNTALRVSKNKGKDVFVISNKESANLIFNQINSVLPDFLISNIITEPEGRNTAPAIAYGALFFNDDDNIAILSSDHYIKNEKLFNEILNKADIIANKNFIVTLGIIPDSPKTGYGYIKKTDKKIDDGFYAEKFVEKPTEEKAKEYIKDGSYYWNAGIFIFKIKTFIDELKIHSPEIYNAMEKLRSFKKENKNITIDDYREFKSISIDYALMEKTKKMIIIPTDIGWNDIGGFKSLYEVLDKDNDNNVIKTENNFININSKNLLVMGNKKIISAINVNNLAIIDTDDALLVSDINQTEKVKDVYIKLDEIKSKSCIEHIKTFTEYGIKEKLDTDIEKLIIHHNKTFNIKNEDFLKINVVLLKGDAVISIDNKKTESKVSDCIILDKNKSMEIKNISDKDNLELILVYF